MAKKRDYELDRYTAALTRDFARWDYLYTHGGQDPFWPDGMSLNLVRNHILSDKRQIEDFLKDEKENTLFSTPYPDIYYRPTPDEVDGNYMARADEILARAKEQFALYEQDSNFQYILAHFYEAFPHGETRAHKDAGIHPGMFSRFIRLPIDLDSGNLVDLRRDFYKSYEDNCIDLADKAKQLQMFLEADHSKDDLVPINDDIFEDDYTEENNEEENLEEEIDELAAPVKDESKPTAKLSLDDQIKAAKIKTSKPESTNKHLEEQLSLF